MINIKVEDINFSVTNEALKQLALIIENDFTIKGQVFRLKVDGKGCGGFDYALGFTAPLEDDLIYRQKYQDQELFIHIDPFTAFYCKEGTLEYVCDIENDREGFGFINYNEEKYRGKFFKDESMVPN